MKAKNAQAANIDNSGNEYTAFCLKTNVKKALFTIVSFWSND